MKEFSKLETASSNISKMKDPSLPHSCKDLAVISLQDYTVQGWVITAIQAAELKSQEVLFTILH